jgi:serine/threonine-protein kinase ATR
VSNSPDVYKATDGNAPYTVATIKPSTSSSDAKLVITLPQPQTISFLTVWGIYSHGTTEMSIIDDSNVRHSIKSLTSTDNYKQISFRNITHKIAQVEFVSNHMFQIKEVAGLGTKGCVARFTLDLGETRMIQTIRSRHWAGTGTASALKLKISEFGNSWVSVDLDPNAVNAVVTRLPSLTRGRYITFEYTMYQKNYVKVFLWEVDAWDENSIWGVKTPPKPQRNSLRSILGVNGIWGWGHNTYSSTLPSGEGPTLYNEVASHARNYHNMDWDVLDPDNDPEYPKMASGGGTNAKSWLNWDTEYKAWKAANLKIDVSVQFSNFQQSRWDNLQYSAFNYGKQFAMHFGPVVGNGLIDAVEVGNEPWSYEASFYKSLLQRMSAGIRSIDRQIKVLPGAFQAHEKRATNNYIGTRIDAQIAKNVSVINFHTYSYVNSRTGARVGVHPEHPESSFNSLRNMVRWRDTNLPTHPLWVTEWGWDAPTAGETCTFPECVTETEQAVYGVRGLLILSRYMVDKVTWFFYSNSNCNHLYCRSGLTSSSTSGFTKRPVFHAFKALLSFLGDSYFQTALAENENIYVYLFGKPVRHQDTHHEEDKVREAKYMVLWRPEALQAGGSYPLFYVFPQGTNPVHAVRFTGTDTPYVTEHLQYQRDVQGSLTMNVTSYPVLIELSHTPVAPVLGF